MTQEMNSKKKKIKVLLIEDDSYTAQLYRDVFSAETDYEFEVIDALSDIEKDLEKIKKINPDVILLDLVLPLNPASRKNVEGTYILDKELGFQVLEKIKEDEVIKEVPVIVVSALSGPEDKDRAKALGAEKFLVKSEIIPFELVKAVNEVLGRY